MKRLWILTLCLVLGALAGAQEIRRPTTDVSESTLCPGVANTSSSSLLAAWGANATDAGGEATYTNQQFGTGGATTSSVKGGRRLGGFAAASGSYAAGTTKLYVYSECVFDSGQSGDGCYIRVSLNNGSTWNDVATGYGEWALTRHSYNIPDGQDLTQVLVQTCGKATDVNDGFGTAYIWNMYDIRIEGTLGGRRRAID